MNKSNMPHETTLRGRVAVEWRKYWCLYVMAIPLILYYLIFHYIPMLGLVISFQNYTPSRGVLGSEFIGLKNFTDFFGSPYFFQLLRNTVRISVSQLIFTFPAPIILALLLNEIKNKRFRQISQTLSYLPHFISIAVVCGMIKDFTLDTGFINDIVVMFGGTRQSMLTNPNLFVPIYIISDIWQHLGWNSIIYISALTAVDQQLYEAAQIDGAGKWSQTLHVTIPGIMPTIVIMFLLQIGNILNVGFEKIILLYNPLTYETADVLSSFIYRRGLQEFNWGYSAAAGMFNSVINTVLLVCANRISAKVTETALW